MRSSLRGRVALAAVLATSVVVVAVGAGNLYGSLLDERQGLDAALRREALGVRALLNRRPDAELPLPAGSFVRVVQDGAVVRTFGDGPTASVPTRAGHATVREEGQRWRTHTARAPDGFVQVGRDLRILRAPLRARVQRTIVLAVAALIAVAAAGWSLGGLALRPLARLRDTAERVASTRDLSTRLPTGDGPVEVDELADRLNVMLARLRESSDATRRFAADAGHELRTPLTSMRANLDVLARSDLPEQQRRRILADVLHEQDRLVALLDALQALARGDAPTAAPAPVDVAEVVGEIVEATHQRHPQTTITYHDPGELIVRGSAEGLRILIRNLVENAARHGGGKVAVSLAARDGRVHLRVDDDGPGVPAAERERIFERFARGSAASAEGSGLGLALVTQQAGLHGGAVRVTDSQLGGASFSVDLPLDEERP